MQGIGATNMYQIRLSACLLLPICQAEDQSLSCQGVECFGSVDHNVVLAGGIPNDGCVVKATENDSIDALCLENIGLILRADQG